LALDYGTRRIGLALSDPLRLIAQPFAVWDAADPRIWDRLMDLVEEQEVDLIVVGLPVGLSGAEGPSARAARRFAEEAHAATGIEVELVDERFSTTLAERALLEDGVKRRDRRLKRDQVAAALILRHYLEGRR
jgi:putative Holliday junction resolvase